MPNLLHQGYRLGQHYLYNDLYAPITSKLIKLFPQYIKLKKREHYVIFLMQINTLALAIGGVFFTIYLWRQYNNISYIAIYNIAQYPTIFLSYLIAGLSPIRLKLRTYFVLGQIFYMLSFLALFLVDHNPHTVLILSGVMLGFGVGYTWVANNSFIYSQTKESDRVLFFGLNSTIGSSIAIIVTPIVGFFLSQNVFISDSLIKYRLLFLITIFILFVGALLTGGLDNTETPKVSVPNLIKIFRNKAWLYIGFRFFIEGFNEGICTIIVPLVAFFILKSEVNIGILGSVLTLASVIFTAKIAAIIKLRSRLLLGFIGSIVLFVSRGIYVFFFSVFGVVISSTIDLFAGPIFGLSMVSSFFDAVDKSSKKGNIVEYLVFISTFLGIGRIVGCVLFWVSMDKISEISSIKIWYLLLGLFPLVYFLITYRFEKLLKSNEHVSQ